MPYYIVSFSFSFFKFFCLGVKPIPFKWRYEFSIKDRMDITRQVLQNRDMRNKESLSNGALMRVAPIALKYHRDVGQAVRAAYEDASLTHVNRTVRNASQVYVEALVALLNGKSNRVSFSFKIFTNLGSV